MKRVLNRRQLVKREFSDDGTPYLSIHRSLQLSILDKLSNDADLDLRQRTFQQAFALVKQQLPEASAIEVCPPEVWQVYLKYVPQLNSLRLHSLWPEPPLKLSDDFAKVLVDVGTYMWNTGLFKECEVAISLAETILETLPYEQAGELMTVVDGIMAKISDLTGVSKRSEGLRRCLRRVESRRKFYAAIPTESVTRTDEIRLFNSEADVGYTLMQDNRFTEAEEIYERCLVAYKSWSLIEEEIPFEYAKYYHHMAHVRALQGRLVEALALGSHAIKLQELHNRGPLSPMVQLYRFSYGMHLYHAGHLQKSLEIHEDVLKTRIQISGALNPWTLDSYSAVGMLLSLLGNHIKAEYADIPRIEVETQLICLILGNILLSALTRI
jgi:tetratricopeptide (TPR) repeat protein